MSNLKSFQIVRFISLKPEMTKSIESSPILLTSWYQTELQQQSFQKDSRDADFTFFFLWFRRIT